VNAVDNGASAIRSRVLQSEEWKLKMKVIRKCFIQPFFHSSGFVSAVVLKGYCLAPV